MPTGRPRPRGLLIAAEGLDGSGKSAALDLLARWLERKGRTVQVVRWDPSRLINRVRGNVETAGILTLRVAALLTAADAEGRADREIRPPVDRGEVVLADRYAWSAIAREIARGVDPDWAARLYGLMPRPDLVLFHRLDPATAVARSLAERPAPARDDAVATAFAAFLARMGEAYERLVDQARPDAIRGPWEAEVLELDARRDPEQLATAIRDGVRPRLLRARPSGRPGRQTAGIERPGEPAA